MPLITSTRYLLEAVTWNPDDKGPSAILSNGNLTAAGPVVVDFSSVRSTRPKTSGKWYWETVMFKDGVGTVATGIATPQADMFTWLGADAFGYGFYPTGNVWFNNAIDVTLPITYDDGDTIRHKLDLDAGTFEVAANAGSFSTAATGLVGAWNAGCTVRGTADIVTVNFGATAFTYSIPGGYKAYYRQ